MNKFYEDQSRGGKSSPDDIEDFLTSQAGSGVATYGGFRYHQPIRGSGFFGRLIKGGLMPIIRSIMPYLGGKAASAVSDFASNLKEGQSFKTAAKRTLKRGVAGMAKDLSDRLGQDGNGVRRRRKKTKGGKKGGKKGKLNAGLMRYLEMKRKGMVGKPKKSRKKRAKTIKHRAGKVGKRVKRRTKANKSRNQKQEPDNFLF